MIVGGRIGQAPYSIEDLWVRVKALFAADDILSLVEFREGHQYLQEWEGVHGRIVFVQAPYEASFGAIRGSGGEIGSIIDVCNAHIWGITPDKDYVGPDQGIAAKSLALEVCAAAYLSFSGMVQGGTVDVASETHVLKYGESCILTIRLRCPIEKVSAERALHIGGAEIGV